MARDPFLLHLRDFVRQHDLLRAGDSVIVAVSGGVDSMVLLHTIFALRDEFSVKLAVAHFNHQLRGKESEEDEAFVRRAASALNLECYVERANTAAVAEMRKKAIQETARDLRYAFLAKLTTSIGFTVIATAHHADDNAETMLFNFVRGAGVSGLSGIPLRRADIPVIRPLLFARRDEIRAYASAGNIAAREDSSNENQEYARNYLRKSLIPDLEQHLNPNLALTLGRTSEIFDHLEQYLDQEAARVSPSIVTEQKKNQLTLSIPALHSQHIFLQEHLLRQLVKAFTSMEIDFPAVKTLLRLSHGETGHSYSLTKEIAAYRDRDHLTLRRLPGAISFRYRVELNKEYRFEHFSFHSEVVATPGYTNNPCIEFVDADLLGEECVIRTWHDGDWFMPLGMTEKKKLSDFFIDEKVPLSEKRLVPILASGESVVWICGRRLDDRYKITSSTRRVLKLHYTPQHAND